MLKKRKKKPKPRVPHLALPSELGSEYRYTIHPKLSKSHPSCPY